MARKTSLALAEKPDTTSAAQTVTLPSRISDQEVAYLQRLVNERALAQSALDKFTSHLTQMYQLGEKDRLDLNGAITRAPKEAPTNG